MRSGMIKSRKVRTPEEQEKFLNEGRFRLATDKARAPEWFSWFELIDFSSWLMTGAAIVVSVLVWLMRRNYKS